MNILLKHGRPHNNAACSYFKSPPGQSGHSWRISCEPGGNKMEHKTKYKMIRNLTWPQAASGTWNTSSTAWRRSPSTRAWASPRLGSLLINNLLRESETLVLELGFWWTCASIRRPGDFCSPSEPSVIIDEHREIGWRINLDAIHQAFLKTISVFPDSDGAQYEVQSNNNLKLAAALRSCYRVLRSSLEGLTVITFLWLITTWSKSSSPRLSSNILQAPAIGYTVKSQSSFLNVF